MEPKQDQPAAQPDQTQPVPPASPATEAQEPLANPDTGLAATNAQMAQPDPDPDLPESFSWEASEFVHHDKPAGWYALFFLAVVLLAAVFAYFHQWMSIAVVATSAAAILVYTRKQPRTLAYTLDSKGITIGTRFEPYNHFRSYNIQPEVAWHEFDLEPAKRFAPRLTVLASDEEFELISKLLSAHLPYVKRAPDAIDRATRYIKF